jgi:hypothetical protein
MAHFGDCFATPQPLVVILGNSSSLRSNGFIPLSKCQYLRLIDLTLMFEHVEFDDVLRPFRNLEQLSDFTFPRNTHFANAEDFEDIQWPPNLNRLTFNGYFVDGPSSFEHLVSNWPRPLRHLVLNCCPRIQPYTWSSGEVAKLPYELCSVFVTDQCINKSIQNLAISFSQSKYLSIPANAAVIDQRPWSITPILEKVEIRRTAISGQQNSDIPDFLAYAMCIKSLRQIRVHKSVLVPQDDNFTIADTLLKDRAGLPNGEVEAPLTQSDNAGIVIFGD